MSVAPKVRLLVELRNELDEIARLVELIDQFGETNNISPEIISDLQLVLEEVVANVISYGYKPEDNHSVFVTVQAEGGVLSLKIEDKGVEFNPLARPEVRIDSDVEERPIGGLGIFLTKKLMDSVEYRREQDRNVLVISKRYLNLTEASPTPVVKGVSKMEVTKEKQGTALIVHISGRLDILNSKELGNELTAVIDEGNKYLVLEMSGLEYVSSSGLRVLLQARKSLKPVGGTVVLCAMTEFVRKVVETTGFGSIFKITPTPEAALAEAPAG